MSTRRAQELRLPSSGRARLMSSFICAAVLTGSAASAQDEREPGWYDKAELSFVGTDGNAEATTFSFGNKLERLWDDATFAFTASALRAESTSFTRVATGTPTDFRVVEDSDSELTAEKYALGLRYDREISERFFWHTGADWTRNEFAGFDSRIVAFAGVGHRWWNDDSGHFRTDYALTWTSQDDLIDNPNVEDSWLGLRLGWDYERAFGSNATYSNILVLDGNVDETDDFRADMVNALQVAMTERLAIKVSLQWLFDNLPALTELPLVDASGIPTGDTVLAELEELDSIFTVALVVNF